MIKHVESNFLMKVLDGSHTYFLPVKAHLKFLEAYDKGAEDMTSYFVEVSRFVKLLVTAQR